MDCERSKRLATCSQRRPLRATIDGAAPCEAKRSLRRISAIAAGRASIRASVTKPGSSARSRRSSMRSRSSRSRRLRDYRSQRAHASGRGRRCRIRGTGMPWPSSSQNNAPAEPAEEASAPAEYALAMIVRLLTLSIGLLSVLGPVGARDAPPVVGEDLSRSA